VDAGALSRAEKVMTRRTIALAAAAAALACGDGGDGGPGGADTVTAGCETAANLCIDRTGPTAQVQTEMQLCVAPLSTPVASCPTAGRLGGCKQMQGTMAEITWFYPPTWTAQSAAATCDPPDVWLPAP
jgi:hypothetical protein